MSNPLVKLGKCFLSLSLILLPVGAIGSGSIGDAAENLLGPTSLVTKLVEIGCYVIGLAFVMMSFAQYKIHRQSPKLVPLATPITLLILGIIALLIPYSTQLAQTGKTDIKREANQPLPLPGERPRGATLPYPPNYQQEQQQQQQQETTPAPQQYEAPATSPAPGGNTGGWTSDPRYRK